MSYCIDCTHHRRVKDSTNAVVHLCIRRQLKHCLVTRTRFIYRHDCDYERSYGWLISRLENLCGREGRFFEPKDTPHDTP